MSLSFDRQIDDASKSHIHIPTPGDHYSPATGSAIMTVIYEMLRCHTACGGQAKVIVGQGTRHDYPVGLCVEVGFFGLPNRKQKMADIAMGRVGLPRRFMEAVYRPAFSAINADFDGSLFLHNAPGVLPMFRRRFRKAQICLYVHNVLFNTYSDAEMRRTLNAADRILCVSKYMADRIANRIKLPDGKIRNVLNGVDTDRFRPVPKLCGTAVPTVLFVGRIVPEKGPDLLLKAAQKVYSRKRRFKIRIVGSSGFAANDALSSYELELRKIAEPMREMVEFQPFVDRLRVVGEYQSADIFCGPSNCDEGCSLTVPEAIACGLPTIASRRGGIPEVGGDAVLYFQPPNVNELADLLIYLLEDEKARREWGCRARARAEAISWENQYRKLRAELAD